MPRAEPEPAADVWGRVAGVASDTGPRPLAPPPLPSPAWRGPLFRTQRGAPYYEDLETLPWKTNCKNLVRWSMPREAPVVLVTLTNPPETEWLAELARGLTWDHKACTTTDEVAAKLDALELALPRPTAVVVAALGTNEARSCWPLLRSLGACAPNWRNGSENQVHATAFPIVFSHTVNNDPRIRLHCLSQGARMVTDDRAAVEKAFEVLDRCRPAALGTPAREGGPLYTCPDCGMNGLTEDQLHAHGPMFHAAERSGRHPCPVCHSRRGWPWHFHNCHGPVEDREPAQSYFAGFSLVVCRSSDGRFLMVNEVADNCMGGVPAYWLPAGRVDQGEGFLEAARRETMEEGGVEVEVNGVLRFTLSNLGTNQPCPRLILLAEPIGSQAEAGRAPQPKTVPDWESVGAMWVYPEQLAPLRGLDYRSTDPARYFPAVASGRLAPWPVQTDSFRRLEAVMAQLTRKPGVPRQEQARLFMGAWQGLKAEYPPDMFKEH